MPQLRGEDHPDAKLTWADVDVIREMRRMRMMLKEIAPHFGVSVKTISKICSDQAWVRKA